MKNALKSLLGTVVAALTRAASNGPAALRAATAFALGRIDDRRLIDTGRLRFYLHVAKPIERWRADTLLSKEPETIAWLERTIGPDSVFYDVGANVGLYALYAAHLHPGRVRAVCFEPEPMNLARLNQNIAANGLSGTMLAYGVGLGETRTIATLTLSGLQGGGALHGERHRHGAAAAHLAGLVQWPLDELLAAAPELPRPTHLKIDVDGPELAVVRGATKALAAPTLRHALVETTLAERNEIEALLAAAGFKPVGEGAEHAGMFNLIFEKLP